MARLMYVAAVMGEGEPVSPRRGIVGLFGRPYVDLEPFLELGALPEIHDEICLALTSMPVDYTGGSHRSMGIMPESRRSEAHGDYGEVISKMTDAELATFVELSDEPERARAAGRDGAAFGEERDVPLSRRQMLWLKMRFGVYFPWKAYVELIPNRYWSEKASPEGKDFTHRAKAFLPKTIAFVRSLPFQHVGRCNVMGLEAHDHGTVHRDNVPSPGSKVDHFILVCPRGDKRFFVWDDVERREVVVPSRAFWFNDGDYHGVLADPFFRYSLRIDGVFRPDFLARLEAELSRGASS